MEVRIKFKVGVGFKSRTGVTLAVKLGLKLG